MPPQPGQIRSRWAMYVGASTFLAGCVVLKSLAQRPNFYSAAVYLSQSNANKMILCNFVLVTACTFILYLQKLMYGPLRNSEIELLYERAWFAVTETCLAMTIFRGEIGVRFLIMFFALLTGKVWGWIGEGRVEVLEQQQGNVPRAGLFHTRLALSLALSVVFDLTMLEYTLGKVMNMARPDSMVMFAFEFAILGLTSLSTATRYSINLFEIGIVRNQKDAKIAQIKRERVAAAVSEINARYTTNEERTTTEAVNAIQDATKQAEERPVDENDLEVEGWEVKGRYIFYLDLATDFLKLVILLSFFFILLVFYGLPLHIMRDVFITCRSFFKRIADFVRYRTATRDMNERYPDAGEAEIGREDVCIICREEMRVYTPPAEGQPVDPVVQRMRPKKLPCGHVLHLACLKSWLERQQNCPTCRASVVPPSQTQNAARQVDGVGPGQHQPGRQRNRPRVFQLGPLRVGFGTTRGNNAIGEMAQQMAEVGGRPGGRHYGFNLRWDGGRRRNAETVIARADPQNYLNRAEAQIQRELDNLQREMGELDALRDIQAQINRVRMARQPPQTNNATQTQTLPQAQPPQRVYALRQNMQSQVLQAGSDQLPAGLTLPEGWSMMPLHANLNNARPVPTLIPPGAGIPIPGVPHMMLSNTGIVPIPGMPLPQPFQRPSTIPLSQQGPSTQSTQSSQPPPSGMISEHNDSPAHAQSIRGAALTPAPSEHESMHVRAHAEAMRQHTAAHTNFAQQQSQSTNLNAQSQESNTGIAGIQPTPPLTTPIVPTQRAQTLPTSNGLSHPSETTTPQSATVPVPGGNTIPSTPPPRNLSPQRVNRSIGSSWGFPTQQAASNDHEDDSDDDDDDDIDDEEKEEDEAKRQVADGKPKISATFATSAQSATHQPPAHSTSVPRRQPFVEEHDDDDEDSEDDND